MHEQECMAPFLLLEFDILDILLVKNPSITLPKHQWLESVPNRRHIPVLGEDIGGILITTDVASLTRW